MTTGFGAVDVQMDLTTETYDQSVVADAGDVPVTSRVEPLAFVTFTNSQPDWVYMRNGSNYLTAASAALTFLAFSAVATPAAGQFGLRGGMNLSKFVGSGASNSSSATGLNVGASIPLIHIGPLSIVPEVYYSQKGAKQFDPAALASGTTTAPTTLDFGLDYIEVPVLAKLSFPLARLLHGYVAGGPAYAWNVNCSISVTSAGATTNTSDCNQTFGSFKTAMQKADRGIVAGGGLDFNVLGLGGLNLDARVIRGLTRLTTSAAGTTGADIKNQSVSLMLGYYIGRGR